jgi:hypothetical protein
MPPSPEHFPECRRIRARPLSVGHERYDNQLPSAVTARRGLVVRTEDVVLIAVKGGRPAMSLEIRASSRSHRMLIPVWRPPMHQPLAASPRMPEKVDIQICAKAARLGAGGGQASTIAS